MTDETKGFLSLGFWNRQKELLDEAHRLHLARRAVREAKSAASLQARTSVNEAAATPAKPIRMAPGARIGSVPKRAGRVPGVAREPVPAWRSAAARMGSSLVAVGERLERLAARSAGPS